MATVCWMILELADLLTDADLDIDINPDFSDWAEAHATIKQTLNGDYR